MYPPSGSACLPHISEVTERSLSLSEGAQYLTGTSCNSSLLLLKDLCKWCVMGLTALHLGLSHLRQLPEAAAVEWVTLSCWSQSLFLGREREREKKNMCLQYSRRLEFYSWFQIFFCREVSSKTSHSAVFESCRVIVYHVKTTVPQLWLLLALYEDFTQRFPPSQTTKQSSPRSWLFPRNSSPVLIALTVLVRCLTLHHYVSVLAWIPTHTSEKLLLLKKKRKGRLLRAFVRSWSA